MESSKGSARVNGDNVQEVDPTSVIDQLARNELLISDLYGSYARCFSELADFWTTLAADEKRHAAWLQHLKQLVAKKEGTINTRFSSKTLVTYQSYLEKQCALASDCKLDLSRALGTSVYIEKSLIENRFFEIFDSRLPEWAEVKQNLVAETRIHLNQVQQLVAKLKNLR